MADPETAGAQMGPSSAKFCGPPTWRGQWACILTQCACMRPLWIYLTRAGTPRGYRQFTPLHLLQMRLARAALRCTWMGGEIRRAALEMLHRSAAGEWDAAQEQAYNLLALVQAERVKLKRLPGFSKTGRAANPQSGWVIHCSSGRQPRGSTSR